MPLVFQMSVREWEELHGPPLQLPTNDKKNEVAGRVVFLYRDGARRVEDYSAGMGRREPEFIAPPEKGSLDYWQLVRKYHSIPEARLTTAFRTIKTAVLSNANWTWDDYEWGVYPRNLPEEITRESASHDEAVLRYLREQIVPLREKLKEIDKAIFDHPALVTKRELDELYKKRREAEERQRRNEIDRVREINLLPGETEDMEAEIAREREEQQQKKLIEERKQAEKQYHESIVNAGKSTSKLAR